MWIRLGGILFYAYVRRTRVSLLLVSTVVRIFGCYDYSLLHRLCISLFVH